jgi:hypothetical protein
MWVERRKKYIARQGRHLEKETVTAPAQSPDSEQQGESTNLTNGPRIYILHAIFFV